MKCDGSPDPTMLPEINMYMSLWREDVEDIDFETVLKESALVLKVSHCWYIGLIIQITNVQSVAEILVLNIESYQNRWINSKARAS